MVVVVVVVKCISRNAVTNLSLPTVPLLIATHIYFSVLVLQPGSSLLFTFHTWTSWALPKFLPTPVYFQTTIFPLLERALQRPPK